MNSSKITRILIISAIALMNIGCDQVSKMVVRKTIPEESSIELLHSYFVLYKVENTGAFLGMGNQLSGVLGSVLLIALPLVLILGMFIYLIKNKNLDKGSMIAIASIIGGGVANLYDRVVYGSVTDFMHIDLGFVQTGIFNVADLSISFGFCYVLLRSWLNPKLT